MAGAIADFARKALAADFRTVDPSEARIVLIEAGPRVLPTFGVSLSLAAARALEKLGVEVWLGSGVTCCDADGVIAGGERIEARTLVWAAGVMASKAGGWLDAQRTTPDASSSEPISLFPAIPTSSSSAMQPTS